MARIAKDYGYSLDELRDSQPIALEVSVAPAA